MRGPGGGKEGRRGEADLETGGGELSRKARDHPPPPGIQGGDDYPTQSRANSGEISSSNAPESSLPKTCQSVRVNELLALARSTGKPSARAVGRGRRRGEWQV